MESTRGKFGWRVVLFVVPAKLFETVKKVSHYNVTCVHMGVQKKYMENTLDFLLFFVLFCLFNKGHIHFH